MKPDESDAGKCFGTPRPTLVCLLRRLADDLENVDRIESAIPQVAINSWSMASRRVPCLVGRTLAHPSIQDGNAAASSELFYLDRDRGIARTLYRWYRLGSQVQLDYWRGRLPPISDY
ncbi:hypothetical protein [Rhizobium phaseoli]|uniref:hypothetical protein n=1 Tax=Rhizobium phaseoli TaxID=396 RepID=UPI001FE1B991|nr:hypothetical protein [Rhizobium phaseoli]